MIKIAKATAIGFIGAFFIFLPVFISTFLVYADYIHVLLWTPIVAGMYLFAYVAILIGEKIMKTDRSYLGLEYILYLDSKEVQEIVTMDEIRNFWHDSDYGNDEYHAIDRAMVQELIKDDSSIKLMKLILEIMDEKDINVILLFRSW